jgi:hypothetical protein
MRKPLIALAVLSLMVTGCSSGSTDSNQSQQSVAKINSEFIFMSDFLIALKSNGVDCTGYVKDDEVIGVREQGTCTYGETELTLDLFADTKTATTTVEALKSFGGYWVTSNNWVIVVQDGETAKDLKDKLRASIA